MAAVKTRVERGMDWQNVFSVERRLLHRKLPLTESALRLIEHGVNNGKQKALEKVFDASKEEILEGVMRAREAKNTKAWCDLINASIQTVQMSS